MAGESLPARLPESSGARLFYADWALGVDTNAGTIGSPVKSLNKLLTLLTQPGDIGYLRGGTYAAPTVYQDGYSNLNGQFSGGRLSTTAHGSAANPVMVTNFPGEVAQISCQLTFSGAASPGMASYIRFRGTKVGGNPGLIIGGYKKPATGWTLAPTTGGTLSINTTYFVRLTFYAVAANATGATNDGTGAGVQVEGYSLAAVSVATGATGTAITVSGITYPAGADRCNVYLATSAPGPFTRATGGTGVSAASVTVTAAGGVTHQNPIQDVMVYLSGTNPLTAPHDIEMDGVEVREAPNSGLFSDLAASNFCLWGCLIHDNGTDVILDHGYYLSGNNFYIANNILYNNRSYNMQCYADLNNSIVVNNSCDNPLNQSGCVIAGSGSTSTKNATSDNCILKNNILANALSPGQGFGYRSFWASIGVPRSNDATLAAALQAGGALAAGTARLYRCTASNAYGETNFTPNSVSNTAISLTPAGGNLAVLLTITGIYRADFINIYVSTNGGTSYTKLATVAGPAAGSTTTYLDDGSVTPAGAPPGSSTATNVGQGNIFDHNVGWGNVGDGTNTDEYFPTTNDHGVTTHTNLIHGNPNFTNAAAHDYSLGAGSAAINAGDLAYTPPTDYFGQQRAQADCGAIAYAVGAPPSQGVLGSALKRRRRLIRGDRL
jgi:hypothetical protein